MNAKESRVLWVRTRYVPPFSTSRRHWRVVKPPPPSASSLSPRSPCADVVDSEEAAANEEIDPISRVLCKALASKDNETLASTLLVIGESEKVSGRYLYWWLRFLAERYFYSATHDPSRQSTLPLLLHALELASVSEEDTSLRVEKIWIMYQVFLDWYFVHDTIPETIRQRVNAFDVYRQIEQTLLRGCPSMYAPLWSGRKHIYSDLRFYLPTIQMSTRMDMSPHTFEVAVTNPKDPKRDRFSILNPSIACNPLTGAWVMCVRYANYNLSDYQSRDKSGLVQTLNLLYYTGDPEHHLEHPTFLDSRFWLTVAPYPTDPKAKVLGLEDVRLFYYGQKLLFLANCCDWLEHWRQPCVVMGEMQPSPDWNDEAWYGTLCRPSLARHETKCEKNWMPLVTKDERLLIVYSITPRLVIYEMNWDTKATQCIADIKVDLPCIHEPIRGSGVWHAVPAADSHVFHVWTHEVCWTRCGRMRTYRFRHWSLTLADDATPQELKTSDPFHIVPSEEARIQYSLGPVPLSGTEFVLPYSTHDEHACFGRFSFQDNVHAVPKYSCLLDVPGWTKDIRWKRISVKTMQTDEADTFSLRRRDQMVAVLIDKDEPTSVVYALDSSTLSLEYDFRVPVLIPSDAGTSTVCGAGLVPISLRPAGTIAESSYMLVLAPTVDGDTKKTVDTRFPDLVWVSPATTESDLHQHPYGIVRLGWTDQHPWSPALRFTSALRDDLPKLFIIHRRDKDDARRLAWEAQACLFDLVYGDHWEYVDAVDAEEGTMQQYPFSFFPSKVGAHESYPDRVRSLTFSHYRALEQALGDPRHLEWFIVAEDDVGLEGWFLQKEPVSWPMLLRDLQSDSVDMLVLSTLLPKAEMPRAAHATDSVPVRPFVTTCAYLIRRHRAAQMLHDFWYVDGHEGKRKDVGVSDWNLYRRDENEEKPKKHMLCRPLLFPLTLRLHSSLLHNDQEGYVQDCLRDAVRSIIES